MNGGRPRGNLLFTEGLRQGWGGGGAFFEQKAGKIAKVDLGSAGMRMELFPGGGKWLALIDRWKRFSNL